MILKCKAGIKDDSKVVDVRGCGQVGDVYRSLMINCSDLSQLNQKKLVCVHDFISVRLLVY